MQANLRLSLAIAAAAGLLLAAACNPASSGSGGKPQAAATGRFEPPAAGTRPNIILIMVDTLRADRLGVYGHPGKLTPNMDALAAEGATFERAISPAPWTLPSIGSIFTGFPPCIHKATSYMQVESMNQGRIPAIPVLDASFETLAERLQAAGYQTAGFCGNKFVQEKFGFAQGFEHFDASFSANNVAGQVINAAAGKWLSERRDAGKPLFLYLHYMDPHGPYDAAQQFHDPLVAAVEKLDRKTELTPQQFQQINLYLRSPPAWAQSSEQFERLRMYREYWVARYEAGVSQFDHHLGALRSELQRMGLWDDALIILTADHGEALGDHVIFSSRWRVWDHGMTQHQTDLHVPLLVRWPGVVPERLRVTQTAGTIGLYGTIPALIGLPNDPLHAADALVGHLSGAPTQQTVVADALKNTMQFMQIAAIQEQWKLILTRVNGQGGQPAQVYRQLFDLASDPGETRDLANAEPERVAALNQVIADYGQLCRNPAKRVEPQAQPATPEDIRNLNQLGYVAGGSQGDDDEEEDVEEEPGAPAPGSPASQPASGAAEAVGPP